MRFKPSESHKIGLKINRNIKFSKLEHNKIDVLANNTPITYPLIELTSEQEPSF